MNLNFVCFPEDFNRHILDPELGGCSVEAVQAQAKGLYHAYMATSAPDRLPFPGGVVTSIRDSECARRCFFGASDFFFSYIIVIRMVDFKV